ncbi:MAG: YHS domain-containing protein [Desulfomonile tiedjei]|uniref:YHS domain-containing protein n=1 Tax=Desulfomonile tiedjei TaxID=2358 RepID=A0A9D6Z6U2_9BACT|nr:YHS domain-containing protein [Desulfomonile tiedjei]
MWAKFLLFAAVIYTGVRVARFLARFLASSPSEEKRGIDEKPSGFNEMVRDPVCGLYITSNSSLSAVRRGSQYWFCSEECRRKFLQKEG